MEQASEHLLAVVLMFELSQRRIFQSSKTMQNIAKGVRMQESGLVFVNGDTLDIYRCLS